ncbi:ABC transporter permease [Acaryochloris marina]|uniref:ABC transporter permease n=1 Tax=Acaryochloris marina TaxID=155978 RepID=UPI001BAF9E14|nr:ABC transporter permease [Acaryochloris marina]QUY42397.1 ABC transporter permease [Acaryochloris marina S15]
MTSNSSVPPPQPNHQSGGLKPTIFWRIAEDIPGNLKWALMVTSIVLPFGLWWGIASTGVVNSDFLPSPTQVGQALRDLYSDGLLVHDTLMSCFRVGVGFLLAAIVSAPVGIAMGTFTSIRSLLEPIMGIVRYMPAPAFTPLLLIYLGVDERPKIALIFIGTVFFNILMVMDAVKFIPKELLETTYTLGGRRHQVLFQVITPYVIPNILDAFRVNMAASWNLVVVAELIAAEEGLGKRIAIAEQFFRTDTIFACLIVLGLIGFGLDLLFRWLQRAVSPWAID